MAFAITSAMRLLDSGRTTRRNVIEDSADAFPRVLCARDKVRNMRATAKQTQDNRRIFFLYAFLAESILLPAQKEADYDYEP